MNIAGWKFHYNGDGPGEVGLVSPDGERLLIPFVVLAELVGSVMRDQAEARLGELTGREYLTRRQP